MSKRHQIEIDDEDYERLRKHYGKRWAVGARRILTRKLDDWDREEQLKAQILEVRFGPDYSKPLTGGPKLHGRFGWYVMCRKLNHHPREDVTYSCVVYAEEDTRQSAGKRAREILDLREWAVNESSTSGTSRGGDIDQFMRAEGIV